MSGWQLQVGKSPLDVVVLPGVDEGQAGMAGTDRAPVWLVPDRCFVTNGESNAVVRHARSAVLAFMLFLARLPAGTQCWLICALLAGACRPCFGRTAIASDAYETPGGPWAGSPGMLACEGIATALALAHTHFGFGIAVHERASRTRSTCQGAAPPGWPLSRAAGSCGWVLRLRARSAGSPAGDRGVSRMSGSR
jgi:hypothetical protein